MANDFYVVTVEDQVIQITSYIVRAEDIDHAQRLVTEGIYAFESECEVVDTVSSEIKSVEEIA
jgi:predicted nucleic acid-binding protein